MKNRQAGDHLLTSRQQPRSIYLQAIAQHIAMRKYDSLRLTRTSAGKQQTRFGVSTHRRNLKHACKQLCRKRSDRREQRQCLQFGNPFQGFNNIDHSAFRPRKIGHLLSHLLGRQNTVNLCLSQARLCTHTSECKIQIDRLWCWWEKCRSI